MDEAESYWDILGSDAAASVMSDQDKEEVEKTVENLKAAHSLAKQCQERISQKVKSLKASTRKSKAAFTGSKVPFPKLSADMSIESMVAQLPPGCTLEIDRFNGRWKAAWQTPETKCWKRVSRSWGVRGHVACLTEIQVWAWSLAEGYGLSCPYQAPSSSSSSAPSAPAAIPAVALPKNSSSCAAKGEEPAKKRKTWTGG